jgi:hypothetical protein
MNRVNTDPDIYEITITPTIFFGKPIGELSKIGLKLKSRIRRLPPGDRAKRRASASLVNDDATSPRSQPPAWATTSGSTLRT